MKKRQTIPMFSPVYHFNGKKWFNIILVIFDKCDNDKLLYEFDVSKNPKFGGVLMSRRRNDAIFELYLNNKLEFPMILCDGYFMESNEIQQYKYMNIYNFEMNKKLKYVEKYLQGLMQTIQKKLNIFGTYDA
eukprot:116451_1